MSQESEITQDLHSEKLKQGSILVMDIAAVPRNHGMDIEMWVRLIKEQGIAFYDSSKGNTPFYTEPDQKIVTYDVQEEKAMSELEKILEEEDVRYKEAEHTTPSINFGSSTQNLTITGTGTGEITGNLNFTVGDSGEAIFSTTGNVGIGSGNVGMAVNNPSEPLIVGTAGEGINLDVPAETFIGYNETTVPQPTDISQEITMSEPQATPGIVERFLDATEQAGLSQYNNLTEENLTQALDEVFENRVSTLESPQTNALLTDQEVTDLSVQDPRMTETRASRTLTSRRGPSVRARRNIGPSFELTDDTE